MITEDIKLEKEIWIIYGTTFGGAGTKIDPYIAVNGDLDRFILLFGSSCKVHLGVGLFLTAGFKLPKYFILLGAGKRKTLIKLKDNTWVGYPHLKMLSDDNWSFLFIIKDLTLDGNWAGQLTANTNGNFKIEPLVVRTIRGKADNVRVINFGANAKDYGLLGLECFPLTLQTFSNGDPFNYFSVYNSLKTAEETTYIEINECEVAEPHFISGGYCTAIFVKTNFINQGDRQPVGSRNTRAAVVRNNRVCVPGGIAYGAASSEMVWFEGNVTVNSKCGFNFDTSHADRISILNNQFINCSQGINFTPSDGGSNIQIDNNIFIIGKPFFNPVTNKTEDSYCINAQYLRDSAANHNYMIGDYSFLVGIGGVGNVTKPASQIVDDGRVTELSNEIVDLKSQLSSLTTSLNQSNLERGKLGTQIHELTERVEVLTSNSFEWERKRDELAGLIDQCGEILDS